jgi:hypothetical protein
LKDSDYIPAVTGQEFGSLRRQLLLWVVLYIFLGLFLTAQPFIWEPLFDLGQKKRSLVEVWGSHGEEECGLPPTMIIQPSIASAYCLIMQFAKNFVWLIGDFLLLSLSVGLGRLYSKINGSGIRRIDPGRLTALEIDLVREHHALTGKAVKVGILSRSLGPRRSLSPFILEFCAGAGRVDGSFKSAEFVLQHGIPGGWGVLSHHPPTSRTDHTHSTATHR